MLGIFQFDTNINTDLLKRKILRNEPKILKKYSAIGYDGKPTDGRTGLGFNSLTSRSPNYNVLSWWGINFLKKEIKKNYEKVIGRKVDSIYVQCWANVLRDGEQIKPHAHEDDPYNSHGRFAGNLVVSVDQLTHTYYDGTPVENKIGRMIIFPSQVLHWTDTYRGKSERITIAFDIKTHKDWQEDVYDDAKHHWIKIS